VKGKLPVKTSRLLLLAALISAAVPMMAQVNDTYVIPAAANARGNFGTHWMTRFSVFNPWLDYSLRISITFVPSGGAQGIEELIDLPPNSLAYSDNILLDLFGLQAGSGSLLVAAFAEDNPGVPDDVFARSFLVTSDTFNNHPSGTYGQTIAGTWTGLLDYEYDQISSVAHGIRNSGKWRTNVGALNLGRCTVSVNLNVYDADGNKILNQAPFLVPPLGHFQQGLPIAVNNGTVEFFVVDPCVNDDDLYAIVFPYTSTIDGQSGDPTYQSPTLLASPSILYAKGKKVDPTAFGKKIDSSYARNVRAQAERRGVASLKKTEKGWAIEK
jgi:hypothetical protein